MQVVQRSLHVSKQLVRFVVAIVALSIAATSSAAPRPPHPAKEDNLKVFKAPWDGELKGTGARRPTEAEWQWGEENLKRPKSITLNELAFQRINEARTKSGKRALSKLEVKTVPLGREVVSNTTSTTSALSGTSAEALVGLATNVDNSTLKYFPPIRSQGSLGSCAQFSAVYYTLTHMTALARDIDAKAGGDTVRFSPKWTYNMVNGGNDAGSWHYDAYSIAIKHGLATWAEFPYDSNFRAWSLNPQTWRNAINYRAATAGKITGIGSTTTGLDNVKQLLLNGYVLNFATYIYSWQWDTTSNDPSTTADDAFAGKSIVRLANGTSGGHAMTIVGYNDDIWLDLNKDGVVTSNEKGALRIANSWGTGWGEGGFAWVSYDALRTRNPASSREGIFWYDEATWVTARTSYTPKLLAEFSLSHLTRSQMGMALGVGAVSSSTPTTTWSPSRVLSYAGGAFAFDGTTVEVPGTFYFDATELIPSSGGAIRYFLSGRDSSAGNPLKQFGFSLIDVARGVRVDSENVQPSVDGGLAYASVDYDFSGGVVPPQPVISVSAVSGDIPLTVTFDGSGSSDPQGSIAQYSWEFGDGAVASGATVQHTYTRAGSFVARLTIVGSSGAVASATQTITVTDPNIVLAPSGLSASATSRVVTLRWTDNSSNETAFKIERAPKAAKGSPLVFVEVGTAPTNATSFSQNVAAGTYYYRVRAVNTTTGALSPYSATVSLRVR